MARRWRIQSSTANSPRIRSFPCSSQSGFRLVLHSAATSPAWKVLTQRFLRSAQLSATGRDPLDFEHFTRATTGDADDV